MKFLSGVAYPARCFYLHQLCDCGGLLTNGGTLSMDGYCFPEGGGVNEYSLFGNYKDLREVGLLTSTNTAVYVQSVGLKGQYRTPTGSDLRYNMMAALAENSEIGIVARDGYFAFNEIKVDPLSRFTALAPSKED